MNIVINIFFIICTSSDAFMLYMENQSFVYAYSSLF